MSKLVEAICHAMARGENLVLATIITQEGSTPRTPGTKMAIRSDSTTIGTIGGGLVEAQIIQAAAEVFQTTLPRIIPFDLTGLNVEGTDLICGGRLETLVEFLSPTVENLQVFQALLTAQRAGQKAYLVSGLGSIEGDPGKISHGLLLEDGSRFGDLPPPGPSLESLVARVGQEKHPILLQMGAERFLVEPVHAPCTVYVFGAGHISEQVAALAGLVGFRVIVFDDRAEFANPQRFPKADEVRVIPSFDGAFEGLTVGGDSYLVIVTRGHMHDGTVLRQAIRTTAGYIGMIGSRRKREVIFQSLLSEGFTVEDLKRVHSPIGLEIGAETPEEIGLSIVAELVHVRSQIHRT